MQHNGILAEKKKELTDKQKSFLSNLFDSGGNINLALEKAGYSKTSRSLVLKTLSDEILEAAKTISKPTGTTGSFWNPESIENNEEKFSYLLIVILDKTFQVDKILELNWENFMKNKRYNKRMRNYNISVTNKLVEEFKIIFKKN